MISPRVQGAIIKTGFQLFQRLAKLGRQLWHEVVGTLFLVIGLFMIPSTIRVWRMPDMRSRAIGATIFIIVLLYYGTTSFHRAKKVSRGKS